MATNTEQLRALCAAYPQYEPGSAYVRTKILCGVLTKLGESIPSWIVLRQHIGKGSSNDIARGVKDFRAEHADLLQRLEGLPMGIPDKLIQPMETLWHAALTEATAVFGDQREKYEAQQAEAERIVSDALLERDSLAASLELTSEKLASAQLALAQEKERANSERAAREQAEHMAEKHIADLTQQRDDMTRVVEANTAELRTLTARLEDERHRSLMQIEQARQQVAFARQQAYRESEQKMAKLETELRSEIAVQTVEIHRWQKRSSELEEKNAKLTEQLAKEIRATPASTKKRKPALKSAPGRTRRLKGRRTAI